jgi:hypothetical protein
MLAQGAARQNLGWPAMPGSPRKSMPTKSQPQRRPPPRHRSSRKRWRLLLLIPIVVVAAFSVSVVGAATSPGNQNFEAKWADWLRAHHAGFLAQHFEEIYYSLTAPPKGGRPKALNHVPGTVGGAATTSSPGAGTTGTTAPGSPTSTTSGTGTTATSTTDPTTTTTTRPGLAPPHRVPLLVQPALSGEGSWAATGPLVRGAPTMYVAQFRADTVYTSEITSAVWMDPKLLRIRLVPGYTEPGGTWSHPPYVTPAELPRLVAAFNGGFRFQDARGGFYLDGITKVPLVNGAASFVIYKDGQVNIGEWGRDIVMGPHVEAVLQNVVLLVDHGQLAPSATYTDNAIWGYTLGGGYVVPRAGIGITADGALVYVAGPALTAKSLAESLQRAGAVRAMTLDINPEWVTFNFYSHEAGHPSVVSGTKLYPEMQRSADRYLPPIWESRDFFEVLAPGPVG